MLGGAEPHPLCKQLEMLGHGVVHHCIGCCIQYYHYMYRSTLGLLVVSTPEVYSISELSLDHGRVLRLFGPLLDSLNQPLDDILINPRAQAHSDTFFTSWNSRRYHRSHDKPPF